METEDNFAATPIAWDSMLHYERDDAVLRLCRQFSFFCTDDLKLTEREEVLSSSGAEAHVMGHLIIHGSVGNARKDAFLRLLRLARLTLVQDIASQVVVSPQIGDVLPNSMLYPLWETCQIVSLRKWNCVYWAMRCGLLRMIKRRRDVVQLRVQQILATVVTEEEMSPNSEGETMNLEQEKYFYNTFRDLLDLEQGERLVPLEYYHAATGEERVNLSTAIASVPTLIVVWASWDMTSIEWLREHLFNAGMAEHLETPATLSRGFSSVANYDPWLQTVAQFVQVPRRRRLRKFVKRSRIILLSVDREKTAACEALEALIAGIGGWKSPEVSLLPLWCGPDGLQSHFATDFSLAALPFFIATRLPEKGTRKLGDGGFPRICYITPHREGEISSELPMRENARVGVSETNLGLEHWHTISKDERKRVTGVISRFLECSDVPLRFVSRVDRTYQMIHVLTVSPARFLNSETTSFVSLSGTISMPDLQKLREEIGVLLRVKNFFADVRIMRSSAPVRTQLNPPTPTRYVLGTARNITCSECFKNVFIDKEHHFRCIHCDQMDGVVCWRCFLEGKHPQHHVLLRVSTGADTTLHLLWGPSNVSPLAKFCGTFLTNTDDTHVGVYCNSCSQPVKGVRWKCAMCYQYDMCDRCDEKRNRRKAFKCGGDSSAVSSSVKSPKAGLAPPKFHTENHLFLCIRHGCGADGDACLRPIMEKGSLHSFIVE